MKTTLLIDGQVLQTNAWHRGMGKYTLQVMHQLSARADDNLKLVLVLNSNLPVEAVRIKALKYLCPHIEQVVYDLPLATDKTAEASEYKAALDAAISDDFPEENKQYLVTSPFFFDFFAEFPANCHKLMLFYDLTPLLFWRDLGGYFPPDLYMQRFQKVLEAEHIFAISETTRRDLLTVFGLDPNSVTNINGGFTKIAESTKKPTSFEVPKQYVLFPTGDLPHKNNEVAVKGFEAYHKAVDSGIPLLITSHFQEKSKERLKAISDNIIFTENVTDEELEWLYEHAQVILFASKYEGLGLPILDAVASKKPVVTSQIAVFEEMSTRAFYYFEPTDYAALGIALKAAITKDGFSKKLALYPKIMAKYTWLNTCMAVIERLASYKSVEVGQEIIKLPRIAVACLHPGVSGQIGRFAERLHRSLSRVFEVDYYFDADNYHYREMERPTFLDFIDVKTFDINKLTFASYAQYDQVVYLLDDMSIPSRVAQRACTLPGIVITDFADSRTGSQDTMLKDLAVHNQLQTFTLAGVSYDECQKLVATLSTEISKTPTRVQRIIRAGGSNKAIIRRLKVLPKT